MKKHFNYLFFSCQQCIDPCQGCTEKEQQFWTWCRYYTFPCTKVPSNNHTVAIISGIVIGLFVLAIIGAGAWIVVKYRRRVYQALRREQPDGNETVSETESVRMRRQVINDLFRGSQPIIRSVNILKNKIIHITIFFNI